MKKYLLAIMIGMFLIPYQGVSSELCKSQNSSYYENCMIDNIYSLVTEK